MKTTVLRLFVIPMLVFLLFQACNREKSLKTGKELFTLLNPETSGIQFRNIIDDTSDITMFDNELIYFGAGVATGDINNDGLPDVFFVGNQVPSKLYLNLGDFKFKDISEQAGIFNRAWCSGAVMADVNGDSLLDIYVCVTGYKSEKNKENLLFINNGNLTFSEKAKEYGLNDNGCTQMATFFDYDNDGDLDMYLVNTVDDVRNTFKIPFYTNPALIDTLNSSKLFENMGDRFIDVTVPSNIKFKNADGFNASIADVNNDGYLDIYVNNDLLQPDFLYVNNGNKTFTESLNQHFNTVPTLSMSSAFSDFNNDGLLDLISAEMMPPSHLRRKNNMPHPDVETYDYVIKKAFNSEQHSRNMLQIQNHDGSFSEVGEFADISRTDFSFATLPCDFNNDGHQDIFVTNGVKRDLFDQTHLTIAFDGKELYEFRYHYKGKELIQSMPVFLLQNYIYENNGDLTFSNRIREWGLTEKTASQGAAYSDLNNDGYPELLVSNTDSFSYIYRNNGSERANNNYLKIKLAGERKNKFGLGAKVKIYANGIMQYQQLQNGQGWQSSSEPCLFFGLGKAPAADSIEIWWVGGKYQKVISVKANQTIVLRESEAGLSAKENQSKTATPTLFTSVQKNISPPFMHREKDFLDYRRDKMIPKMISREGPGIAVGDINNDGMEDFFVGGAAGQSGSLYVQQNDGMFTALKNQPWISDSSAEDMSPLFFDLNNDNYLDLYITSGSNEFDESSHLLQDRIYINNKGKSFVKGDNSILPTMKDSKGIVKSIDIDGDNDIDLLVCGRMKNQHYPDSPESYLLINENGKLLDKTDEWCAELKHFGMITDAKFADMNKDGKTDLVVCGEWLPVSVLINAGNKLVNKTSEYGLDKTNGWWNSIAIGDFNNDGQLDIAAGNYGLNSILKCSEKEPVVCYYNDFDKNDSYEPVLCYYKDGILAPYADRDLFCRTLPSYFRKFLTYEIYGKSSVTDIFTPEQFRTSKTFNAYHFESTLFINRNGKFFATRLPNAVQIAPIYGMSAFDYDQDGNLDLLAFGNTYSSFYEEGPMAGLRGNLLKGDGKGGFNVLNSATTGISLNKDSKAAGLIFVKKLNAYCLMVTASNDILTFSKANFSISPTEKERIYNSGYLFNYTPPQKNKGRDLITAKD